ncbi:MAG TPA: hypothetical protein PLM56_17510 [Cyclobacteriaceae bacterium]|nr:hypothetical protein [Cyclobacteriaceae bacterium]
MKHFLPFTILIISISTFAQKPKQTAAVYYPGKEWQKKKNPAFAGVLHRQLRIR